ncbi:MAG TPA: hypothetical protein VFG54_12865, partial [Prolixibacteraceae bacterium]|nr:hypothetical protein [Prolixibacteraceae bacterium]
AKSARPIDAFSGVLYPHVYDFTVNPDWHILTFYNTRIEGEEWPTDGLAYWDLNKQFIPKRMLSDVINVELGDKTDDGGLGLDTDKEYYVFDFWNWQFIGEIAGTSNLEQELRPGEARVMAVHQVKDFPQFLSTSRHILQGYLDMAEYPEWNTKTLQLSAVSKLIAGEVYKVVIAANGYQIKKCSAGKAKCEIVLSDKTNFIYELRITSEGNGIVPWTITFEK